MMMMFTIPPLRPPAPTNQPFQRVKDERDALTAAADATARHTQRAEQALRVLCNASDRQRAQLLREAKSAQQQQQQQQLPCGAENNNNNNNSGGDAATAAAGGGGGGGAASSSWTAVVSLLARMKLPKAAVAGAGAPGAAHATTTA